jgi:hypothetical protein
MDYVPFYDLSLMEMQFLDADISFHYFNSSGGLIQSGNTSSIVCYDTDDCGYFLFSGHGEIEVRNDTELVLDGFVTLDNPKFLRVGVCENECNGKNELLISGLEQDSYIIAKNNETMEEEEFLQPTLKRVCLEQEDCLDLHGSISYFFSNNVSSVEGNTHHEIKSFGTCSSICEENPILMNSTRGQDIVTVVSSISGMAVMSDVDSPYYRAACWLIYDDKRQIAISDNSFIQRYILALLYYISKENGWHSTLNFLSFVTVCKWNTLNFDGTLYFNKGIHCNDYGEINTIMLSNNNLVGVIPHELSWFVDLEYLNLGENEIEGFIPFQLGYIKNMKHLILPQNGLTSSIPDSVQHHPNLVRLVLEGNLLTGTLGFQGYFSTIHVQDNMFTGSFPNSLMAITSLSFLSLNQNLVSGTIPNSLTNLTKLKELILFENSLKGPIPSQLFQLPSLETVALRGELFPLFFFLISLL